MSNCNTVLTPLDPGLKLSKVQCPNYEEAVEMRNIPYINAVGKDSPLLGTYFPDEFDADSGRRLNNAYHLGNARHYKSLTGRLKRSGLIIGVRLGAEIEIPM
ncbi:hypothetical protein B0H14DRAFT_3449948 [Mycena olivaceomarginata]|nr:hypothetical protein B0H14DRAFT_3449948 [Mycena olivaceomarginata]